MVESTDAEPKDREGQLYQKKQSEKYYLRNRYEKIHLKTWLIKYTLTRKKITKYRIKIISISGVSKFL